MLPLIGSEISVAAFQQLETTSRSGTENDLILN
jgi:hypothetical protein